MRSWACRGCMRRATTTSISMRASDEDSLRRFRHAFGPDTYAWEEPQANFIVLDDVVYRPAAEARLRRRFARGRSSLSWHAYLATGPKERLLVLALHIPLFEPVPGVETFRTADRERLFALLRDRSRTCWC